MSKSKITPLVAIRSIPNEGVDGWWLNSQPNRAMRGFTNNIGWVNGGDENADIAAFIVKAVNAHEALVEALEKLIRTSDLLQINAIGCAVNHHQTDFSEQGTPGWLEDTKSDIDKARTALALAKGGE